MNLSIRHSRVGALGFGFKDTVRKKLSQWHLRHVPAVRFEICFLALKIQLKTFTLNIQQLLIKFDNKDHLVKLTANKSEKEDNFTTFSILELFI